MAFDPDKYIAEKSTFDPDKYLEEKQAVPVAESKTPSLLQSIAPRTTALPPEVQNDSNFNKQRFSAEFGDVLSAPGRAITAAGAGLGTLLGSKGNIKDAYDAAKIEAANKGEDKTAPLPTRLIGGIAKSPATLATLPLGGPGAGIAKGLIFGTKTGAAVAAANQVENVAEGKKIDPLQAAGDVAIGTATGGALPVLGSLAKGIPAIPSNLMKAGSRIANKNIGISAEGQRSGAELGNIGKYGLFGKAQNNVDNAKSQIADAASGLKAAIEKASDDPANKVNVSGALALARQKLTSGNMSEPEKMQVLAAFNNVTRKIETPYLDKDGIPKDIDLLEAQLLKRYVGKYGDWLSNPGAGMRPSPDASVESQIYNSIYDALKTELENKGGKEVAKYNKIMSDLIPLERDASKRALVQARNNPISFDNYLGALATAGSAMTGNLAPAGILGLNIASKSPSVGKLLYKTGEKLGGKNPLEQTGTKGASIADALKRRFGNERGAVGAVPNENSQIHSDNFKKWSDNAPVVKMGDASEYQFQTGKPVVVEGLHGSDQVFTEFKNNKLGSNTGAASAKKGHFFTDSPDNADAYPVYDLNTLHDYSGILDKSKPNLFKKTEQAFKNIDDRLEQARENEEAWSGGIDFINDLAREGKTNVKIDDVATQKLYNEIIPEIQKINDYKKYEYKYKWSVQNQSGASGDMAWAGKETTHDLSPNVSKNYINFKNPLVHDFKNAEYRDVSYRKLIDEAEKNGHDGVILLNTKDPYKGNIFVALNKDQGQIKSATGNSGAYSKLTNNVNGSAAVPMMGLMAGTGAAGIGGATAIAKILQQRKLDEQKRGKK